MKVDYFNTDVGAAINEFAAKLLTYVGALALLVLVAGGIYYMASIGDPEKGKKAKNMISYAVIGLSIIMFSYAILTVIEKIAAK
jgi:glucose uptake protein GlcU